MFEQLGREHRPACRFRDRTAEDSRRWKRGTLPRVLATLGNFPRLVPPHPDLIGEWEHVGLRKQRWLIDVGRHISATFQVNFPAGLRRAERRPALPCWHGHGPFGKDAVMGKDFFADIRAHVAAHNYHYGHQMARNGFITYAIDWMGCGDRNEIRKPNFRSQAGARDWCKLYLHATMLGMTSLGINLAHGRAATDFALTLPHVGRRRLGVMGLSGGGTTALWTALVDRRFRAVEIICYSDRWAAFGFRDVNYCGMQVVPGLYKLVDLAALQGLLAPLPLLVDIGVNDSCFRLETALACFRRVRRIYRAAGAADRLELDLFPGEHGWGGNKSVEFFGKHL